MSSSERRLMPVAMQRVALVAPEWAVTEVLSQVAAAGVVEVEQPGGQHAAVDEVAAVAVRSRYAAAWAGWMPTQDAAALAARIAPTGGAVVPLPRPRGEQPPTLLRRSGSAFTSLVQTYSTVPYADVDPTLFAAVAYVVMFGLMFGDVGHGLLLLGVGLAARLGHWGPLRRLRPAASVVIGAGAAATAAGVAYGELFGPTGVVPALWLSPLDDPVRMLVGGLSVGAVLLSVAYAIGTVNRVREGGWRYALYAPSGIAGATVFLGLGLLVAGLLVDAGWLVALAVLVSTSGLALSFAGLYVGAGRGGAAAAQAVVELVDLVVRLGSNVVSFARLAAFGLTHAALSAVVWSATTALWGRSLLATLGAVAVLVVGNTVAFALEALVAAVQALRLEYYELFSRVFELEGRPFRPWHVPLADTSTSLPHLQEASS